MVICRTREELRDVCRGRDRAVLVPTMGGLHAGHAALVRQGAREAASRGTACVVTVFVNPTQFGVPADFERYPRDLDADAAVVARAVAEAGVPDDDAPGAGIVYAPAVSEVYPEGPRAAAATVTEGDLPPQATGRGLEDAFRPGHFRGVALVLSRLYRLVEPSAAIYGEKDWQQLQVARAMAPALPDGTPIGILGGPTVRDSDGLALSSRNRFLTPDQRRRALAIPEALRLAGRQPTPAAAEQAMTAHLAGAGVTPNYATIRDAETLLPLESAAAGGGSGRALIAAPLGEGEQAVRLLDNMPWPGG